MALDTREKRASAVSLTQTAPPTVTPNSTPDREWRQQSGWGYSGLSIVEVAVATGAGGVYYTLNRKQIRTKHEDEIITSFITEIVPVVSGINFQKSVTVTPHYSEDHLLFKSKIEGLPKIFENLIIKSEIEKYRTVMNPVSLSTIMPLRKSLDSDADPLIYPLDKQNYYDLSKGLVMSISEAFNDFIISKSGIEIEIENQKDSVEIIFERI
jgi:hypothetical protein